MHIDHQKLVELLTDASGIEEEKIEKQLEELVEEIQQALADGEAYEIEGFGIFSGIGNRILFIPSKELETEINFKYVGMEPIELEEGQVQEEEEKEEIDPFEELQGEASESKRDPFSGLVEGFEEDFPAEDQDEKETSEEDDTSIFGFDFEESANEEGEQEPKPGPEEWGIDAHKEDDRGANRLISSLMGEELEDTADETEAKEEPVSDEESVEDEVTFDDIFGDTGEEKTAEKPEEELGEESVLGLDAELASLMSEESEVKSEDELAAGILEDDLSDIFGELEEEPNEDEEEESNEKEEIFDDDEKEEVIDELAEELEASEQEEAVETETREESAPDVTEEEPENQEVEETKEELSEEETEEVPESNLEEEFDDFDDPFLELESDEDEEESKEASKPDENIIPVITNISSDLEPVAKAAPKKEKKQKKEKPKKTKTVPQPASVWLWIILILVIIVGTTVGLGYFSIINIPGITPQVASTNVPTVAPPPVQQPPSPQPQETTTQLPDEEETPVQQPPIQEQQTPAEVPVTIADTEVPENQDQYGMMGVASNAANDGYTIILYSLSIEANAFAKQQELSNAGYRALVTPVSSAQYGTLWRVSIGQFATLTDAAIAAEDMPSEYKQSYFIKRITN